MSLRAVVNVSTNLKPELLTDASGVAVTTKVNADWTKVATLLGVGTTVTPAITHRANGYYDIVATFPTEGNWSVEYSVVINGETVPFDPQLVQVVTAAQADPAAALGAATIVVTSPVAANGDVTINTGDAYLAADGRALMFTFPGLSSAFNGRTATLTVRDAFGVAILTKTATISVSGGIGAIAFDLTSMDTALTPYPYRYRITATLPDGSPVTLAAAAFVVAS